MSWVLNLVLENNSNLKTQEDIKSSLFSLISKNIMKEVA